MKKSNNAIYSSNQLTTILITLEEINECDFKLTDRCDLQQLEDIRALAESIISNKHDFTPNL